MAINEQHITGRYIRPYAGPRVFSDRTAEQAIARVFRQTKLEKKKSAEVAREAPIHRRYVFPAKGTLSAETLAVQAEIQRLEQERKKLRQQKKDGENIGNRDFEKINLQIQRLQRDYKNIKRNGSIEKS